MPTERIDLTEYGWYALCDGDGVYCRTIQDVYEVAERRPGSLCQFIPRNLMERQPLDKWLLCMKIEDTLYGLYDVRELHAKMNLKI